jgi:DNA-binding phage protein
MRDRPFDEVMIENFREDPAFAATLVNSILEDGDDQGELQIILGLIAAAFGASSDEQQTATDINRLAETFRAIGLRLSVTPVPTKPRRRTGTAKRKTPKRVARPQRSAAKTVHA